MACAYPVLRAPDFLWRYKHSHVFKKTKKILFMLALTDYSFVAYEIYNIFNIFFMLFFDRV